MTYLPDSRVLIGKIRYLIPALLLTILTAAIMPAQDSADTAAHPLLMVMQRTQSALKTELRGRHPRIFITEEGIGVLRQRARTTHRELWQRALANLRALKGPPPEPPAQERDAQADVGLAIAEAALAFKIEGDAKYMDAARRYMDAAARYEVWGYLKDKPNVDLPAGQLLYGLSWGYDLLFWDLTEEERSRFSRKIARQARLLAEYYAPKPGRTYAYHQGRLFLPMTGLAVAAYALYEDVADAPQWARLARAMYDRVLFTFTTDGYFSEGFEHWAVEMPWILHYLDALSHATGEDLYDRPSLKRIHLYAAHSMLPGGKNVFDFGDAYEGALTRIGTGTEIGRTHPGGNLRSSFNVLYRLASRFGSSEAQGVAEWLRGLGQSNSEDCWSLLWFDPAVPAQPMDQMKGWHYFDDHEVVFWRTDWTAQATAIAFKCGPPLGHRALPLLQELADWQPAAEHAHPDANSFIFFARGKYLTGDSGSSGVPVAAQHNTLLVDGRGQGRESKGNNAFDEVPYTRLNGMRIADMRLGPGIFYVVGDAASAYEPELELTRFSRQILFTPPDGLVLIDDVAAKKSQVFTALLHSDSGVKPVGGWSFTLGEDSPQLLATVVLPAGAKARIEPNNVPAAGDAAPGIGQSVQADTGKKQLRGNLVAISTPEPVEQTRIITLLKIQ